MNIPHPKRKTLYSILTTVGVIVGAAFVGIMSEVLQEICTVIVAHQAMALVGKLVNHFGWVSDESEGS